MVDEKKTACQAYTDPGTLAQAFRAILKNSADIYAAAEPLRQIFLKLVETHQVPYTDNLRHPDLWIVYPCFTSLIERLYPSPDVTILDWGGLYGHVTTLLNRMGYKNVHNYLLDIPHCYEIFRQALHIETCYGHDPNLLSLPDASYDIVISSGVLEHVREDGKGEETLILSEIRRVLKPGGTFWIWYLPNRYSLSEALSRLTGRWHHRYRYSQRQITSLLREAGFDLLYLTRHGFLPGTLKRRISPPISVPSLFRSDMFLANLPFLKTLAANFLIISGKR